MIITAARKPKAPKREQPDSAIFNQIIGQDLWIRVSPKSSPKDYWYIRIIETDKNGWFKIEKIEEDRLRWLSKRPDSPKQYSYGKSFFIISKPTQILTGDELFPSEENAE